MPPATSGIFSRAAFALVLLCGLFCGACVSADKPKPVASMDNSARVLVIGDSLTVGPFGDQLQAWLLQSLGPERVAIYASCGSSPEHWLAGRDVFVTPCGYRETNGRWRILEEYHNGRKPRPVKTPKIETLLAKHRPQILIIQLGTNHFDTLQRDGKKGVAELEGIYEEFARAVLRAGRSLKMVVWITPPDSAKFPAWIENEVERVIVTTNRRHRFGSIISSRLTRYVPGKTGSDGVHYNDAAGAQWAGQVIRKLDAAFIKTGVKN